MVVKTTKRNISFFKVVTKNKFSLRDILLYINWLEWNNIYTSQAIGEEKVYLRDLKEDSWFVFWIMSWMRMTGIPQKWKMWKKEIKKLWLKSDEWITETTHFLYAPSREILMVEYNHYWPRIWALQWHLNDRANTNEKWWFDEVDLKSIPNKDFLEKLNDFDEIKSLSFSIPKSNIENLWEDSIFSTFSDAFNFWDTWEISIVLKSEKWSREPILKDIEWIKKELEKIWYNIEENFNQFKIKALSKSQNKTRTYDFLQDKFKTEISVIKLWKSRDIDSEDILEKMIETFNNNKDELINLTEYE